MSVEGYVGHWGSGKTLMLARDGIRALKAGRTVGATFHLAGDWGDRFTYFDPSGGVEAMLGFESGLLLVDEINIVFPSRKWSSAPTEMLYFWSQSDKRGTEVRWSSQSEKRVDTVIREITHYVHQCRCFRSPWGENPRSTQRGRPQLVRTRTYLPGDSDATTVKARGEKCLRTRWARITPEILDGYDTLECVRPGSHIDGKGATPSSSSGRQAAGPEARPRRGAGGEPPPVRSLARASVGTECGTSVPEAVSGPETAGEAPEGP